MSTEAIADRQDTSNPLNVAPPPRGIATLSVGPDLEPAHAPSCSTKSILCFVDVINVLFILLGVVLCAIGYVGKTDYSYLSSLVSADAFNFFIAAGVFVIVICCVAIFATHAVLNEDKNSCLPSKPVGRILLIVYFLVMLLFIVCELVGSGMWLTYAGELEQETTGNARLDESLNEFQDFVDRRVNCSFNYCCQKYTNGDGEGVMLRTPYNYESGKKSGGESTTPRGTAYEYFSAKDFVPGPVTKSWRAAGAADSDALFNRTQWAQQYYNGLGDMIKVVNNDKEAQKTKGWNANKTIATLSDCEKTTAATGSMCWLKWKAQCPDPVDLTKDAWDDICSFVHDDQTWIYTDTDLRPNKDDSTEPLLTKSMCDMTDGHGAVDDHYGYKTALISKLKNSVPLAICILIFALVQIAMLISVLVVIFHFCCEPKPRAPRAKKPVENAIIDNMDAEL